MSSRFTDTVYLSLYPSRYLAVFIVLLHALVVFVTLIMPAFPWWVRLIMAAIVLLSTWRALRLHYWQQDKRTIIAIQWLDSEQWQVRTAQQSDIWVNVSLKPSSVNWRWLCVLNFQHASLGHLSAVIVPDGVNAAAWQSFQMRWVSLRAL